jgi:hypothetical protein
MNLNFSQLIVLILLLSVGLVSGTLLNNGFNGPSVRLAVDVRHPVSGAAVLSDDDFKIAVTETEGESSLVDGSDLLNLFDVAKKFLDSDIISDSSFGDNALNDNQYEPEPPATLVSTTCTCLPAHGIISVGASCLVQENITGSAVSGYTVEKSECYEFIMSMESADKKFKETIRVVRDPVPCTDEVSLTLTVQPDEGGRINSTLGPYPVNLGASKKGKIGANITNDVPVSADAGLKDPIKGKLRCIEPSKKK